MTSLVSSLRSFVARALLVPVPRDYEQPRHEFLKRRFVVVPTLLAGAALLALSLGTRPGDPAFYLLSAGVAVIWVLGAFLSGPLHLGYLPWRGELRRPVLTPLILGALAAALFVLGALIVRNIGVLRTVTLDVLQHAERGSFVPVLLVTLANGVAEEIFFRGALYAAVGRRYPVAVSTAVYAAVTVATWNVVLVFAGVVLGLLLALQRRTSGGVLAPIITHVTWSAIMLAVLPALLGR